MLMLGSFTLFARVEHRLTATQVAQAQAQALMLGGVEYTRVLLDTERGQFDNQPPKHFEYSVNDALITLDISNASGFINLNHAPLPLLRDMLVEAFGLPEEHAQAILTGLRPPLSPDLPPPQPIRDVRDLRGMPGMNDYIYNALINYVTTGTTQTGVNVRLAPLRVLTLLAHGDSRMASNFAMARETQGPLADLTLLNTPYHEDGSSNVYHLEVGITLPSGQHFKRLYWIERKGILWRASAHTDLPPIIQMEKRTHDPQ